MGPARANYDDDKPPITTDVFLIAGKVLRRDTDWTNDEVEDVSFWCKVCLALLIGALWGSLPVQGLSGLLFAIAAIAGLQSGFLQVWLSIDPEDYGGALTLLFEGAMPTFALFMLTWILTYSQLHGGF